MTSVAGPSTVLSDDSDIQMLDASGAPIASGSGAAASSSADPSALAGEDDDEGDDEQAEDEYEIEYIVSHSNELFEGQLSYYVKWKGYDDSENSWVREEDMGGAQEMIQEYWAKVPKKNVEKMGTKGGKKGGKRQSSIGLAAKQGKNGAASAGERKRSRRESSLLHGGEGGTQGGSSRTTTQRKSALLQNALAPSRSPTPDEASLLADSSDDPVLNRIRSDATLSAEEKATLETQHLRSLKLDRMRKRYARIPDWDPIVRRIEAVEKMSDNKLRVFVNFESGDKMAFESVVVHHRAPIKLLQFYESNLRFKRREEGEEEARDELLEGEEGEKELEGWREANGLNPAEKEAETEKEPEGQKEGEEQVMIADSSVNKATGNEEIVVEEQPTQPQPAGEEPAEEDTQRVEVDTQDLPSADNEVERAAEAADKINQTQAEAEGATEQPLNEVEG